MNKLNKERITTNPKKTTHRNRKVSTVKAKSKSPLSELSKEKLVDDFYNLINIEKLLKFNFLLPSKNDNPFDLRSNIFTS